LRSLGKGVDLVVANRESSRSRNRPGDKTGRPPKAPLTKYYRSGDPLAAHRSPFRPSVLKARRRRWLAAFIDAAVVAVILFCLVYSLIIKPNPKLLASDTSYHSADVYRQAIASKLKALRNKNKITLDENGIKTALVKEFPEIADVSIELPLLGQTPTVRLDVSKPALFLVSGGQNYIIDSQGRVAGKTSDLPQIKNLATVADQSGFAAEAGKQVLSTAEINFIEVVIAQAKHGGVPIQSLTLPPLAAELDLRASDRGYFVKFFLGGDALQQAGQYLAARHNFDQTGAQPGQYLDVRVSGKIFYR